MTAEIKLEQDKIIVSYSTPKMRVLKIVDKPTEKKCFRLQGRHLFLTYAKIEIDKEVALKQIKEKIKPSVIEKYAISTEKHLSGESHLHMYLRLAGACNIRKVEKLDLECLGLDGVVCMYHGNYQSCRS